MHRQSQGKLPQQPQGSRLQNLGQKLVQQLPRLLLTAQMLEPQLVQLHWLEQKLVQKLVQMGQGLLRKHWRQGQVPLVRGLQDWQGLEHGQGQSLGSLGLGQMLSWDQALVQELRGHLHNSTSS